MYSMQQFLQEQDSTMNVIIVREKENDDKLVPYKITIHDYKDDTTTVTGIVRQEPEALLIEVYLIMENNNIDEAKYTDIVLG